MQAVVAKSRSSTFLAPLRPATRASAVRVIAFRDDDKNAVKRGTREARGQVKNVQRQGQRVAEQGKQQLQRGRNDFNRRE